jgi:hypothetical protein
MYSLVARVVPRDGLLTGRGNLLAGWLLAAVVVVLDMSFLFQDYGSASSFLQDGHYYHCWLDYDTGLLWAQLVPLFAVVFLVIILVEAAGAASSSLQYPGLQGTHPTQLTSARFSQRTLLAVAPLTLVTLPPHPHPQVVYMMGSMAEHQQNIGLYGSFTSLSGLLAWVRSLGNGLRLLCAGHLQQPHLLQPVGQGHAFAVLGPRRDQG